MNKRDLRAATQILTGHACLNYHLSKLNRSVQPLYPLCEVWYDTVPHLLANCPMLWQLRVEYFDTHYTTVTDIVDRYNLRRIIGYVNRTNRLEFEDTEVDRSRNSLLVLYDLDLSSQYLRLGSFALCSGPCLDNCWQRLASRYIWGVKGTCFHQLDFWKLIPHLVVYLWLREQNKPSGVRRH